MDKLEPKIKFDRNQILENIHALIRKKNLKIGDVETASGLSVGYLARLANAENTFPSLETMVRLAKALGVSVDWLVEGRNEGMTDHAEYLNQFIQRLFDQTKSGLLDWGRFTVWDINTLLSHGNSQGFPAIEESRDGKKFLSDWQFPDTDPMTVSMVAGQDGSRRVRSLTRRDATVAVAGSCFYTDLSEKQRITLIPFAERMRIFSKPTGDSQNWDCRTVIWYELLMTNRQDGSVQPICNTLFENEALEFAMEKLYLELTVHEDEVRVNPGIRLPIDTYMEKTVPLKR